MDRYSVSIAHRSTAPTFTELGPVVASGLSWSSELSLDGEHTASTDPTTLDPAIVTQVKPG